MEVFLESVLMGLRQSSIDKVLAQDVGGLVFDPCVQAALAFNPRAEKMDLKGPKVQCGPRLPCELWYC